MRRYRPIGLAALAIVALVSGLTASAGAQQAPAAPPPWHSILALQLKTEYRCDFDKVLFDRDIEVGGRVSKEGRARCLDGREFDFTRDAAHEKFVLKLCLPTVC